MAVCMAAVLADSDDAPYMITSDSNKVELGPGGPDLESISYPAHEPEPQGAAAPVTLVQIVTVPLARISVLFHASHRLEVRVCLTGAALAFQCSG